MDIITPFSTKEGELGHIILINKGLVKCPLCNTAYTMYTPNGLVNITYHKVLSIIQFHLNTFVHYITDLNELYYYVPKTHIKNGEIDAYYLNMIKHIKEFIIVNINKAPIIINVLECSVW